MEARSHDQGDKFREEPRARGEKENDFESCSREDFKSDRFAKRFPLIILFALWDPVSPGQAEDTGP